MSQHFEEASEGYIINQDTVFNILYLENDVLGTEISIVEEAL